MKQIIHGKRNLRIKAFFTFHSTKELGKFDTKYDGEGEEQ